MRSSTMRTKSASRRRNRPSSSGKASGKITAVTSWAIGPTPTLDNSRILLTERRGSSEAEQLIRNRWATVREFYVKDDPETDTERLLVEQHRHVELFYTCRSMLVHEFRSTLPGRSSGR